MVLEMTSPSGDARRAGRLNEAGICEVCSDAKPEGDTRKNPIKHAQTRGHCTGMW